MPIHHTPAKKNFTLLPNEMIQDPDMDLRTLGLLTYMLSLPDDWTFSVMGMSRILKQDGKSVVEKCVRQLEALGYLHRESVRSASGSYTGSVWMLSDTRMEEAQPEEADDVLTDPPGALDGRTDFPACAAPSPAAPLADAPLTDSPMTEFPAPVKRSQTKKEINKENRNKAPSRRPPVQRGSAPGIAEVRAYCRAEGIRVDPETFVNFYAARNWEMPKGKKIRDWKACLRIWEQTRQQRDSLVFFTGGSRWADRM